jgi:DNA topoisomerase-1
VPRDLKPEELTVEQAVSLLAERAAQGAGKGGGRKPKAVRARKAAPAAANDAGDTPKAAKAAKKKKKAAPRRKAKADAPPRTGTDG